MVVKKSNGLSLDEIPQPLRKTAHPRIKKIFRIAFLVFLLLFVGLGVMALRMSFHHTNKQILEDYQKSGISITIGHATYHNYQVRYITGGNPEAKTALVLVHGAPGSMDMFKSIFQDSLLQQKFRIYSVERPGYGYSNYGKAEPSIAKQAEVLARLLRDKVKQKQIVVLGHSFGAPVAAYMATLDSRVIDAVLAGGAVAPDLEKFVGLARLSHEAPLKWLASKDTEVAAEEKLAHPKELQSISRIWNHFPTQLIAMHGTKDWMVPYDNVRYLEERVPADHFTKVTLPGESHFFIGKPSVLRPILLPLAQEEK